jgi:hypothetical protein
MPTIALYASVPFAAALLCGSALAASKPVTIQLGTALSAAVQPANTKGRANPLPPPDDSKIKFATPSPNLIPGFSGQKKSSGYTTHAFGTFGIPYTSTRVEHFPVLSLGGSARNLLSASWPYSAVGRLSFKVGTQNSHCTASLIRRSVIVTAAHCVQDFGTPTVFTNYLYTPAHYGPPGATLAERAPYGSWNINIITRSSSWVDGTDTGSGSARNNDVAVMVVAKKNNQFIGDQTGYLAYAWNNYSFVSSAKTGNLTVAATSTLGYPQLSDGGRIMQRVDGPTYTTTVSSAKQLRQGGDLTGGASGGPWIVNFGAVDPVRSGGLVAGSAPTMAVIGVTSWGSANPNTPKDNFSSQFGQNVEYPNVDYGGYGAGNIGSLLNAACNTVSSVGGLTYKQRGFCD